MQHQHIGFTISRTINKTNMFPPSKIGLQLLLAPLLLTLQATSSFINVTEVTDLPNPYPWVIGNTSFPLESRIHGGKLTGKVHPSLAVIIYLSRTQVGVRCTGTYLGDGWVLTAAHCLPIPPGYQVFLGVYDWMKPPAFATTVLQSYPSPYWRGVTSTMDGDIGLIKLAKVPPKNPNIQPACLSKMRRLTGSTVTAYGWGRTSCNGDNSQQLKQVDATGSDACARTSVPPERRFCAWFKKGGIIDQGDSGGPLFLKSTFGKQQLVGVLSGFPRSGNTDCPDPNKNVEYTRVAGYIDWITKRHPKVCYEKGGLSCLSGLCGGGGKKKPQVVGKLKHK